MLKRLVIDKLFGIYSYDLNFECEEDACITILTGPNGFGKTTVLNLVNALYHKDYEAWARIPFDSVTYFFDGKVLKVERAATAGDGEDEESDLHEEDKIALDCCYSDETAPRMKDRFKLVFASGQRTGMPSGAFELFMETRSAWYVTDSRLIIRKTDQGASVETQDENAVDKVARELAAILRDASHGPEGETDEKIALFVRIIEESRFADKEMVLDNRFGFRFKNAKGMFLLPSQLSSGEKHILIQAFDLIFKAQNGAVALIDEPEISFHPAWIVRYIGHLEQIQRLKGGQGKPFQIIVATHSPQLIGQRWDMTRDLFENCKR